MDDWIEEAKQKVLSILDAARREHSQVKLRMALIGYRDIGDEPLRFELVPFTDNLNDIKTRLGAIKAGGGDDPPEDVAGALQHAVNLQWRAGTRLCILLSTGAGFCYASSIN